MNLNKRIIKTMVAVLALFVVLVIYLNIFVIFQSDEYVLSGYDPRKQEVLRGTIYDRNGEILAKSEGKGKKQYRVYPYDSLYATIIGNTHMGPTGLEKTYNNVLTERPTWNIFSSDEIDETELKGQNLQLTIDHGLTEFIKNHPSIVAQEKKGRKVNIIINNPQTVEVYSIYSTTSYKPGYQDLEKAKTKAKETPDTSDDNAIVKECDAIYTQYYCGSVFKIITAATAIDNDLGDFEIDDTTGTVIVGGAKFGNDGGKALGLTDMEKAIVKSSNVYFTAVSEKIGKKKMIEAFDRFCITKQIPFEGLNTVESGITILEKKGNSVKTIDLYECDTAAIASASFGQTPVKVSPMHMALAVSAIANEGTIMKPYLMMKTFRESSAKQVSQPKVLSRACSSRAARKVRSYMIECIEGGTGRSAKISGFRYGGKTGTAQVAGETSHSWFVGFAPAENPEISFCVMVENGGYGGSVCGPIVKDIVNYCRENGLITE